MELFLNLVWAGFSILLILAWVRSQSSSAIPKRTQLLALMAIILLLLPVISLSDDLMAAQGLAETDCSLRRSLDLDSSHHSVVPATLALPEQRVLGARLSGFSQEALETYGPKLPLFRQTTALDSRPPPSLG